MAPSFSFAISASVGLEDEVAGDDDANRKAGPDGQRRGDVQLAADDLLAGVVDRVLTTIADSLDQPIVVVGGKLGTDAQQRGKTRRLGEIPPVIVDTVLETGIALGVSAGLAL